jgi:hypothetical protein
MLCWQGQDNLHRGSTEVRDGASLQGPHRGARKQGAFTNEMFSSFFGNELPLRVWTPFTIAHHIEFRHTGGLLDENSTPLLAALQAVRGIAWCNSSPSSVRHCLYSRSVPASIPEARQHTTSAHQRSRERNARSEPNRDLICFALPGCRHRS